MRRVGTLRVICLDLVPRVSKVARPSDAQLHARGTVAQSVEGRPATICPGSKRTDVTGYNAQSPPPRDATPPPPPFPPLSSWGMIRGRRTIVVGRREPEGEGALRADRDLTEGQVLALTHGDAIRGVVARGMVDQLGLVRVRVRVGLGFGLGFGFGLGLG